MATGSSASKKDFHGKSLKVIKKVFGNRGMVPPPYKYLGPGNPLEKQLVIGSNGRIKKYMVKPYNELDKIASKHDMCYTNGKKTKQKCDYEMLANMNNSKVKIPPGMGGLVKTIIGAKLFANV